MVRNLRRVSGLAVWAAAGARLPLSFRGVVSGSCWVGERNYCCELEMSACRSHSQSLRSIYVERNR